MNTTDRAIDVSQVVIKDGCIPHSFVMIIPSSVHRELSQLKALMGSRRLSLVAVDCGARGFLPSSYYHQCPPLHCTQCTTQ
jgi:hypothetical protein